MSDTIQPQDLVGFHDAVDYGLLCPRCHWTKVHVSNVLVWTRREDQPGRLIGVHPITGDVTRGGRTPLLDRGDVRRYQIALDLFCEECRLEWRLALTQHHGATLIDGVELPGR